MHTLLLCSALLSQPPTSDSIVLLDAFGRNVSQSGITLLDWEGHMANPAIKLSVSLPKGTKLPAEVYIHGSNSRIHFDKASATDRYGINRQISVREEAARHEFRVAIFPDRDSVSENHELVVQVFDSTRLESARLWVPVRVIDQDPVTPPEQYPIRVDFSQDKTGFFARDDVRSVIERAAADWAFFLAPIQTDEVPAGAEQIPIWNRDGFKSQYTITNPLPYRGYLLYVTGIEHDEMRAGGAPSSLGEFQKADGKDLNIRRSGTAEFDIRGNYNLLGWHLTRGDEDWWYSGSQRGEQHDLYSIAMHEMGHAFAFHPRYPTWGVAKRAQAFREATLTKYLGLEPGVDSSDHFTKAVDPVTGYGLFGMEYQGWMKTRRWLITKGTLIALKAIGYQVRDVSAFDELSLGASSVEVPRGKAVDIQLPIEGGVPGYFCVTVGGRMPRGLSMDTFGRLRGTTDASGEHSISVQVQDNDPTTEAVMLKVTLKVGP